MDPIQEGRVVIVGSGLIGCSWAMVFVSGGFKVTLYDIVQEQVTKALEKIGEQLKDLEKIGMLKGSLKADEQLSLIKGSTDLTEAVEGAVYVQGLLYLKGCHTEVGQDLFSVILKCSTCNNGLKLQGVKFCLEIRKDFLFKQYGNGTSFLP